MKCRKIQKTILQVNTFSLVINKSNNEIQKEKQNLINYNANSNIH